MQDKLTRVVGAMRKDDIDVVHLQAFKTLLRPFDDAVQVGGDPVSHRNNLDTGHTRCISPVVQTYCFLDKPISLGPFPPQKILVVMTRSERLTSSSLNTRPLVKSKVS